MHVKGHLLHNAGQETGEPPKWESGDRCQEYAEIVILGCDFLVLGQHLILGRLQQTSNRRSTVEGKITRRYSGSRKAPRSSSAVRQMRSARSVLPPVDVDAGSDCNTFSLMTHPASWSLAVIRRAIASSQRGRLPTRSWATKARTIGSSNDS